MVGRICPPPGGDRVKVSEKLGATSVAPVAPVDTSLYLIGMPKYLFFCGFYIVCKLCFLTGKEMAEASILIHSITMHLFSFKRLNMLKKSFDLRT